MIFPEGKRSLDGNIGAGHLGTGVLVMRSKSVVVPTYVYGTYNLWSVERKLPRLKGKTACVFGKPIDFSELLNNEDRKEAQREIVATIMEAIKRLEEWYLAGAKGIPP